MGRDKNKYVFFGCPAGLTPGMRARLIRALLHYHQNSRCYYCGRITVLPVPHQKKQHNWTATLDHVIPECDGGDSTFDNLVVACYGCNNKKGRSRCHPVNGMRLITEEEEEDERTVGDSTSQALRLVGDGEWFLRQGVRRKLLPQLNSHPRQDHQRQDAHEGQTTLRYCHDLQSSDD